MVLTQPATDNSAELVQHALIENHAVLEALNDYALGRLPSPPRVPHLGVKEREYLATPAGREEVTRLLLAFRTTMTMLSDYVRGLAEISPPLDDLKEAHDASERPLSALKERLERLT